MIEGDNLEVLKLLQKSHAGKVKLIYLDPPYNTGKDFVYPDNFQDNISNYLQLTGQVGEGGEKLSSNAESSGRFHTDWLNMMYPRLRLARNLLKHDGLTCISIDDHEAHDLKSVCDEIFGPESFVGTLTWITTTQPDNIGRARFGLQQNIEYVFVYSKCPRIELPPFILESKGNAPKYPHIGNLGPCRFEIIERAFEGAYARTTMRFKILGQPPREGKQWQIGEEQARDLETRNRVEIVDGIVKRAVYPEDEADDAGGLTPFWAFLKNVETSQVGKAELTKILGSGHGVDTVKPISLLTEILSHLPSDSLVVDLFAGSGTTGQAVYEANCKDGGNRKFLLVQFPFPLSPEQAEQRSSAEYCDAIKRPRNMAELTKERQRRAGKKIREENPLFAGDLGFRVFKLASSNIQAWEPDRERLAETLEASVDHLKSDRTESDILFELLLKLGLDLTVPIETRTIAGQQVHSIGAGTLLVCLSKSITAKEVEPLALGIVAWHKTQAPTGESTIVFRDSAFADDVAKTNLTAILHQHGLENVRSL
jgi:adenine-specific DNA-methyltransferase